MAYVLENENEFERLERQSKLPQCDHSKELAEIHPKPGQRVLDAGCGSGVIARFLAQHHPAVEVHACDLSDHRITSAKNVSKHLSNLAYGIEDLRKLSFADGHFDQIVCRYVLKHLPEADQAAVSREFLRCLKPGGRILLIDMDGLYLNLHPQTETVREILLKLEHFKGVNFRAAGQFPSLLARSGFADVDWNIDTLQIKGDLIPGEVEMIQARFDQTRPALIEVAGSAEKAERFEREYIQALQEPGAVLFYNKFLITGRKPGAHAKILPLRGKRE